MSGNLVGIGSQGTYANALPTFILISEVAGTPTRKAAHPEAGLQLESLNNVLISALARAAAAGPLSEQGLARR